MAQYFLSIRAFFLVAAALAALLLANGCGGASASEITVQTGSMSKAEFIKRADAICAATRNQFTREFVALAQRNKSAKSRSEQEAVLVKLTEDVLLPNYEKLIDKLSTLGAPKGEVQEVTSLLNALQTRLDEIHAQPLELDKTPYPLAKPAKIAKTYGLIGCAESFG
jgi:hypothetical protein